MLYNKLNHQYFTYILVFTPIIMNHLERRGTLCRYPWINLPVQVALVGLALTFATPLACAVFKQRASLPYHRIDEDLKVTFCLLSLFFIYVC